MNVDSKMKAKPLSRKRIREIVAEALDKLGIYRDKAINVCRLLDILEISEDFNLEYEVVDDEILENEYAVTKLSVGKILIRKSVFDGAAGGNSRDRFTLAHEIGHYILHCLFGEVSLCRREEKIKAYENPEWQADTFAGELLVNTNTDLRFLSINDIRKKYRVSYQVAEIQKNRCW